MSWWLVNAAIVFEMFILFMLVMCVSELYETAHNMVAWSDALADRDEDIKDAVEELASESVEPLPNMIGHYKFLAVPPVITIFANMMNPFVTPLPLLVGLLFTFQGIIYLFQVGGIGVQIKETMTSAEQEVNLRNSTEPS